MSWSEHTEYYNGYHNCSSTNKKCQSPISVISTWTSYTSGLQWSHHLGTGVGASPSDYRRESIVKCCCLSGNAKCDGCNYYAILREYQRQQQIQQQIQYEQQQQQQQQIQQQQIQNERQKQIEYEKSFQSLFIVFNIFGLTIVPLVILIILSFTKYKIISLTYSILMLCISYKFIELNKGYYKFSFIICDCGCCNNMKFSSLFAFMCLSRFWIICRCIQKGLLKYGRYELSYFPKGVLIHLISNYNHKTKDINIFDNILYLEAWEERRIDDISVIKHVSYNDNKDEIIQCVKMNELNKIGHNLFGFHCMNYDKYAKFYKRN